MGIKVGLDTNIFLNVKNKEDPFYEYSKKILDTIDAGDMEAIVSVVTIAELCVGYYKANELKEKDEFISGLYSNKNYKILNLDLKVADKSGEIKQKINLKLPDCIISASSILEQATCLITNDLEFEKAKPILKINTSKEFWETFLKTSENENK